MPGSQVRWWFVPDTRYPWMKDIPAPMSRITITCSPDCSGAGGLVIKEANGTSCYPFSPCFEAKQGTELLLRASVMLGLDAAGVAENRLKALPSGEASPEAVLGQLLIRYGARRMEATVREFPASGFRPDASTDFWRLGEGNLDELFLLLPLADGKSCDYQQQFGCDLMCTATSSGDQTACRRGTAAFLPPRPALSAGNARFRNPASYAATSCTRP